MKRTVIVVAILVLTIAADQLTKQFARQTLPGSAPKRIGGVFTLLYAENSGAFLSLGANLPERTRALIFSGLVAVALLAGLWALFANRVGGMADSVAIAFIVGGGIGNLIDRVARDGRVTDFLYLAVGPLHTGVFNVADVAITGGVLWLMVTWAAAARRRPSAS